MRAGRSTDGIALNYGATLGVGAAGTVVFTSCFID